MAYIGQTPTAVPLVAGDFADGSISEAKLGPDAVSLAKMKAGTDGNIISYDASGNPVAIATGSDGQVLTSAGAGAPPAFEAAGVAGISSSANANAIVISADEQVNLPGQPAFLAYNSSGDTNQTGSSGAAATIDFDTEVFDVGGNFASDTFTAPITGVYLLSTEIVVGGITDAANRIDFSITASNRSYYMQQLDTNLPIGNTQVSITGLVDMDATDTASVNIYMRGESSNVCDIIGDGTLLVTSFSGILVA
jgi:archaellum component FlaF (FlaF/FlaG flagellin family)